MKGRIIVFSPHPDDETLGCGGAIAKRVREGYEVYIIFMTDGRHSHRPFSYPPPEELIVLRRKEALNASKVLGVPEENILFLDFEDLHLIYNIQKVRRSVEKILMQIKPSEVFIPHEKDKHPDHQITSLIVSYCIRKLGLNTKLYEYPIYYEITDKCISEEISAFLELKERAINAYRSQINLLSLAQSRPVLSAQFLQKFKRREEIFVEKRSISVPKILFKLCYLFIYHRLFEKIKLLSKL